MSSDTTTVDSDSAFPLTDWNLVRQLGGSSDQATRHALEDLGQRYWYPLYAWVRRTGYDSHDAEDLTQEFFARLLEVDHLGEAKEEKGKFRVFLLGVLRRFVLEKKERAKALKRGGDAEIFSIDGAEAEKRYWEEPVDIASPDVLFHRRWALMVISEALGILEKKYKSANKGEEFTHLKDFVTNEGGEGSYAEVAKALGVTEGNLRVRIHRLRQRFRRVIRSEVAKTVESLEDVDDELRDLFSSLEAKS